MFYKFITNLDSFNELIAVVDTYSGIIGADIESTGLDWILDKILLFQLKMQEDIYIVDVRRLGYKALTELVNALHKEDITLIFHNAKFDMKFLAHATNILLTNIYDTMTVEVVLNAGKGKAFYSLSELAEKYTDIIMEKTARKDFIDFPDDKPFTEIMLQYSALDVIVLPEIYNGQMAEAEQTKQVPVVKLENDLLPVVAKMERDGIRLDVEKWLTLEKASIEIRNRLTDKLLETIVDFIVNLEAENGLKLAEKVKIPVTGKARRAALESVTDLSTLRGWVLEKFNVKSPHQMKAVINLMGIPAEDTNAKTIEEFAEFPIIKQLLEIREVNKQIDSYGTNVVELIHPVTGKIHTEYYTVGTRTGRFSSSKPNMQNVPREGGYRECFLPDEDYVFVGIDYSQQEYRLAGAVSRDPRIIDAYKHGSDMHTATAQILYEKDKVTKEERTRGKSVNFAILYGSTEYGLKYNLEVSIHEASRIIKEFWEGYKNLSAFMEKAGELILARGYSSTPIGRRRYNLPAPTFMNSYELDKWRKRVLREGRNHIIQGGGADIIKIAMVEIFKTNPFGDKLRLCLQIHDELVAQIHKSIKEEGALFIKNVMEEVESRFLGEIPAVTEGWDEFKERWSK